MDFKVVIPARYDSHRLPGKPLADVAGRPLILRTIDQVKASGASSIVVATDDQRICKVCTQEDVQVCMTSADHVSGTDRIAEVAQQLGWQDHEVVINVQGDEPFMPAENIDQLATLTASTHAHLATLATPLDSVEQLHDPNIVKVVLNSLDQALYFSRAGIPWNRDNQEVNDCRPLRHIGIYGYRVAALLRFSSAKECALEKFEKLEQLRALWYDWPIAVAIAAQVPGIGIDTEADLQQARKHFEQASGS